jgi:hypothetical protein
MIKTLRITSIIVAVLAIVSFALPAAFGFRGDKQIEQFLNSAGVIEGFKEAKGEKSGDSQGEVSPLVKQAEAFALYLNPPPKLAPAPSASVAKSEPRPEGPVAAKFKLVGTSRHMLQPELSLALIDEPGKGLYWVRQSSKVGHLIVEQIRDGVVVIRDGQSTFELVAERPEKRSLLKTKTSSDGRTAGGLPPETAALAAQAVGGEVQISAGEKEMTEADIKKTIAELDAMQAEEDAADEVAKASIQVSETDSNSKAPALTAQAAAAAARKKSISDLENMRISAKEARGLGRLGRRLRTIQREPSRVMDNINESNATGVSHPQADLIEPSLNRPSLNEPGVNDVNVSGGQE